MSKVPSTWWQVLISRGVQVVVSWKPLRIVRPQVGPSGCLHRQTLRPHQASTLVYEQFSRIWTLDLDTEKYERLGEDENHVILI